MIIKINKLVIFLEKDDILTDKHFKSILKIYQDYEKERYKGVRLIK